MKQNYFVFRIFAIIVGVVIGLGLSSTVSAQRLPAGSPCTVVTGKPYRSPGNPTVFLVTPECTKRPFFNPAVYLSFFQDWNEVIFIEDREMNAIKKDALNFLPWGPRRTFEDGSLIKVTSDPRVYLVEHGEIHPFESEEAFKALGYSFDQIEDVTVAVLVKFTKRLDQPITGLNALPEKLVFKYPDDPKVYYLQLNQEGVLEKKYIASMEELKTMARADRIAILSIEKSFPNYTGGGSTSPEPTNTPVVQTPVVTPVTPPPSGGGGGGSSGGGGGSSTAVDTTRPTVLTFTVPTSSTSLIVTISSFTASDNTGVWRYLITESSSTPATSDGGWSSGAQTSYTFASQGEKTLYAWAKDTAGNISTSLNDTVTVTLDSVAPVLSSIASSTSATSATITWTADELSSSSVEYGLTASYGSSTISGTLVTSHSVSLTGLSADTLYHFRVSSADAYDNTATSTDYTFRTLADTTAPNIVSLASSTSYSTATITWITNETATSTIDYGTTASYGSTSSSAVFRTSNAFVLTGLTTSTLYHFRISAWDAVGNATTTRDYTFTTLADTTAPNVVSSVSSSTSYTTSTISWTTNEAATSTIDYGTTASYGSTSSSAVFRTSNTFVLTGLTAGVIYHFRISAWDAAGNATTTRDYTFMTSSTDVTAPNIVSFTSSTSYSTATITWTTNETATSTIDYGTTASYGSTSSSAVFRTSNTFVLTGLTAGVIYHFRISAWDAAGNATTTRDYTFMTSSTDVTAPNIVSFTSSTSYSTATITWTTNETATSTIDYGTTASYGSTSSSAVFRTSNAFVLTGLTTSTLYHFRISAWDAVGNATTTRDYTFTTLADTTAPVISSVATSTNGETGATITWTTNEASTSTIEYGTTTAYGSTSSSAVSTTSHSMNLTGLTPNTTYHFRITSWDAAGNATTSSDYTLVVDEVIFTATGSSFSAYVTVTPGTTILWTYDDGTTSSNATSTKNYGSGATRYNRLKVTPWSGLRAINVGYDAGDGGGSQIAMLAQQNVTAVSGLSNAAPYLVHWASSNNPLTSLDFSNFVNLQIIECYLCQSMTTVELHNTPSLIRAVFEDNNLNSLDLSESPALEDLRGAVNNYTTINWGTTGEHVWHICTRDNPQMTTNYPDIAQFPVLRELYLWNDNQSGALHTSSSALTQVLVANNHYTSADLSNGFPAGRNGQVELYNNDLTSINLTNDPGIILLRLANNAFDQADIDGILQVMNSFGTSNGTIDLSNNVPPSLTGQGYVTSLRARGWTVTVDVSADVYPPTITSVASSTDVLTSTITWTTNEASTSTVEYGATTAYGSTSSSALFVTSHSISLTGLATSTLYHFRVSSQDAYGNYATSSDYTFTTLASADVTAPVVSSVASTTSGITATITWNTDESASSLIQYGTTASYGGTSSTLTGTISHSLTLSGLSSDTLYHFRIISQDSFGNVSTSTDYTFRTTINTTYWSDDFERADGTVGNGWVANGGASAVIASGALRRTDSVGYQTYSNPTSVTLPADYVVTATIPHTTLNTNYWGIASRWSGGTGVRMIFANPTTLQVGEAVGWDTNNVTVTVTGGFPASWSVNQNHTISIGMVGTAGTIYLDGSAYGTFTLATNNQTGTGVAIVGEGNNRDWYDIHVGDYIAGQGSDTTPPVISAVTSSTSASTATITWTTNESSTSTVSYGLTTGYGSTSSSALFVTSHSINLTGLTANTTYHFRVGSQDASGNVSTSTDYTFRTSSTDITPPVISAVTSSTSASTATITWTTNESSTSTVSYGLTTGYGSASSSALSVTSHSIYLTGLNASTTYHFRVGSQDASGNVSTSTDYTFRTVATSTSDLGLHAASVVWTSATTVRVTYDWTDDNQLLDWTGTQNSTMTRGTSTVTLAGTENWRGIKWSQPIAVSSITARENGLWTQRAHMLTNLSGAWNGVDDWAPNPGLGHNWFGTIGEWLANGYDSGPTEGTVVVNTWYDYNLEISTALMRARSTTNNVWYELAGSFAPTTTGYVALGSWGGSTEWGTVVIEGEVTSTGSDTTAPTISAVASSTVGTLATISWTTNESSTSTVEYGTTTGYGSTSSSVSSVTSHSIGLSDLTPDMLYHFRVGSQDASGNVATSSDYTFRTPVVDTTPPVISAVTTSTSDVTATIAWTTNEVATSTVSYGLTTAYGSTSSSASLVTSRSIVLTGLNASTTYHFRVASQDASGNVTTSTDYTFRTTATSSGMLVNEASVASFAGLTTLQIQAAASTTLMFRHASIGSNISTGLDTLQSGNAIYDRTNFNFQARGNPGWSVKITDFEDQVALQYASFDVLTMKFCWIDNEASSTAYINSMNALELAYPTKTFVWWTLPVSVGDTLAQTAAYNATIRAYAIANNKVLFDIASIESHQANGTPCTSGGIENMCAEWTDDGGHLDVDGRARMAQAFWVLMSNIANGVSDTLPPIISSVASSTATSTATITWTTNEASTSTVSYGLTTGYGSTSSSALSTTSHSIVLTGLNASTTYHFRVSSQDASGNVATSTDYTFRTSATSSMVTYWSDDFERADGAVGNGWISGYNSATASIASGALRRTDAGAYRAYANPTSVTLPADYFVTATVPNSTLSTSFWGIASRWSGSTGVRVFFVGPTMITVGEAGEWELNNVTVTVTGGLPASWSVNQNHTIGVGMVGTAGTIYLDGSAYGTFTLATNNQTGTGVAIVGEGNNRDWYDIRVTDTLP